MWRASQAVDCNMWQRLSHENLAHSSWSNLGHDQIRKIKSKFQASGGMRQIRQATLAIRKFCQTRCICCCGFMFKWNNSILQHDNWIRAANVELPWSHTHCRIQRLWVFDYCFTNWPLFGFHSSLRRNNCRDLNFQVFSGSGWCVMTPSRISIQGKILLGETNFPSFTWKHGIFGGIWVWKIARAWCMRRQFMSNQDYDYRYSR